MKINFTILDASDNHNPVKLDTPPLTSSYTIHKEIKETTVLLVCTVGKTVLHYDWRSVEDLYNMLKKNGGWMDLGSADEQKPVKEGTVEAWARSPRNPIGGWYGLKKGLRGRFAMFIPPLLEKMGLVELTHDARNNKVKAR